MLRILRVLGSESDADVSTTLDSGQAPVPIMVWDKYRVKSLTSKMRCDDLCRYRSILCTIVR